MRPIRKSMLFLNLLIIPATVIKTLRSKNISFNQLQNSIEVKSDEIVNSFQVSQVYNPSIENESY